MLCYSFDSETKEFIREEEATLDPLETEMAGTEVYTLPAHTTFIKPSIEEKEGFARIFNEQNLSWNYVEDHRRKTVQGIPIENSGTPFWYYN